MSEVGRKIGISSIANDGIDKLVLIWVLYECKDYRKVVDYMDTAPMIPTMMCIRSLIQEHELDKASELITAALRTEKSDEEVANLNHYMGAVQCKRGITVRQ